MYSIKAILVISLMLKLASFCKSTNDDCKQKKGSGLDQTGRCTCELLNTDSPCRDVKVTSLLWNTTKRITCEEGNNYVLRCFDEYLTVDGADAYSITNIVLLIMLACSFGGNVYLTWKLKKLERTMDDIKESRAKSST